MHTFIAISSPSTTYRYLLKRLVNHLADGLDHLSARLSVAIFTVAISSQVAGNRIRQGFQETHGRQARMSEDQDVDHCVYCSDRGSRCVCKQGDPPWLATSTFVKSSTILNHLWVNLLEYRISNAHLQLETVETVGNPTEKLLRQVSDIGKSTEILSFLNWRYACAYRT